MRHTRRGSLARYSGKRTDVRAIYAVDVGSTRGRRPKFAWARIYPEKPSEVTGSSDIGKLLSALEHDILDGRSVALGFEAPLFIPVPYAREDLSRGRTGEGNRAWAAPAGSAVAMLGLHQAAWLLQHLFRSCGERCTFAVDRTEWPPSGPRPVLFCWEAFVSQAAHSTSLEQADVQDAATAAMEFLTNEHALAAINDVTTDRPLSLIGTAALWSRWTEDVEVLRESTLVIKPAEPYEGTIRPLVDEP